MCIPLRTRMTGFLPRNNKVFPLKPPCLAQLLHRVCCLVLLNPRDKRFYKALFVSHLKISCIQIHLAIPCLVMQTPSWLKAKFRLSSSDLLRPPGPLLRPGVRNTSNILCGMVLISLILVLLFLDGQVMVFW